MLTIELMETVSALCDAYERLAKATAQYDSWSIVYDEGPSSWRERVVMDALEEDKHNEVLACNQARTDVIVLVKKIHTLCRPEVKK